MSIFNRDIITFSLDDIISIICDMRHDELIEVVLEIDDRVCDLEFTTQLRDRLQLVIDKEQKNG